MRTNLFLYASQNFLAMKTMIIEPEGSQPLIKKPTSEQCKPVHNILFPYSVYIFIPFSHLLSRFPTDRRIKTMCELCLKSEGHENVILVTHSWITLSESLVYLTKFNINGTVRCLLCELGESHNIYICPRSFNIFLSCGSGRKISILWVWGDVL
jgi:hypothetical protein